MSNDTSVDGINGRVSLAFGHIVSGVNELMNKPFPNLKNQFKNHNGQKSRGILALRNVAVDDLNVNLLEQLLGEHHICNPIATVLKNGYSLPSQAPAIPIETKLCNEY